MTGSSVAAQFIIPIAGTLSLTAWLALVFNADRRPWQAHRDPAPGQESPAPAGLAIQLPVPVEAQDGLLVPPVDRGGLRVAFGAEQ